MTLLEKIRFDIQLARETYDGRGPIALHLTVREVEALLDIAEAVRNVRLFHRMLSTIPMSDDRYEATYREWEKAILEVDSIFTKLNLDEGDPHR